MHKAPWASPSHAEHAERTEQPCPCVYTAKSLARRKITAAKANRLVARWEVQWPRDTASSALVKELAQQIEHTGEKPRCPVLPSQ